LVFKPVAKQLQIATHDRYAWFGKFWPWLLIVSSVDLVIVIGVIYGLLDQTIIGAFFTSSNFVWQLLPVIGLSSSILAVLSLFLDERLWID
jgi:hypothetical protein